MDRKCSKCGETKPLSEFFRDKSQSGGFKYKCKICSSVESLEYGRTKKGLLTQIYKGQKANSKNRGYELPNYTKDELRKWLFNQKAFHVIYDNWVKSSYKTDLKPSLDRIDDYKSYVLSNIQIMTWQENKDKNYSDLKNGINTKNSKSVLQYDSNGNFIKEYYSTHHASRVTNTNRPHISNVCHNKRAKAGGFIWKFK